MYNNLEERPTSRRAYDDDEIDLRYIFSKIGQVVNKIARSISFVFRVLLKRIFLIAIIVLFGLGAGYFFFKVTKPYYTSSMTLYLADIRNEFVEDQLNKLSDMVAEKNFPAIADRLDISENAAREIKRMDFSNLDQDRISEDSILTDSPFRIELSLYDNSLFDTMEPALTSFLENNRYFSRQKRIKQRQVESMIAKLKDEISSIDSVKTVVVHPRGPVNGFVYGEPIDPTNLYRESLSMYKQQVEMESQLERLDNIQVVNGFSPRTSPTGPNFLLFLAIGGFLAFIIGAVVALVLESRK